MLLGQRQAVPRGDWHFEIKYDGYRMLAGTEPGALRTRNGADATAWFPEIVAALGALPAGRHVLDGELVVLDDIGRSDFDKLHARACRRRWYPGADATVFCAFDLLAYRGQDLRGQPIEQRKRALRKLIAGVDSMLFVDSVDDGAWLYQCALDLKLEGIVAKRAGSAYTMGRSADWLKIKRPGAIPPGRFHRSI